MRAECVAPFEEPYRGTGAWAELLSDERHRRRYLTTDRWSSSHEYESLVAEGNVEYHALEQQCQG